jgi:hypothetical protein
MHQHRNVNKSSDEAKIKANVRPCVPKTLCPENDQSDRQDRGLLHDPCDLIGGFRHTVFIGT